MSTKSSEAPKGLDALKSAASTLITLLDKFVDILSSKDVVPATNIPSNPPDPLEVLQTAATLLKAHSTKLSLLMINKPFTPTAIKSVVSDISGTCVPAMMSAVEICRPQKYGRILHEEVKMRVRRAFKELHTMMNEALAMTSQYEISEKASGSNAATRDSIASTGVVWEACDSLIQLKDVGLVGLVVQKASEYRALLQDAISELKEWEEEAEDEGFEDEDEGLSDGEDSITQMLSATNKFPRDREDIKKTLDASLQRMRLMSSLMQAITNKRLKTAQNSVTTHVSQVDLIMKSLRQIPLEADHLAEVLYELDNDQAVKILKKIVNHGREVVKIARLDWSAKSDDFTVWCDKWGAILEKT